MLEQAINPFNYSLSIYAVPTFIISAAIACLLLLLIYRERVSSASVAFTVLGSFSIVWFLCFSMVYCSTEKNTALWWTKIAYLGIPFIPTAVYHFTLVIIRKYDKYKTILWSGWITSAVLAAVSSGTDLIISDMGRYRWGYYPLYGPAGSALTAYFIVMIAISIYMLYREYLRETSPTRKIRTRAFLIAFSVAFFALVDFLPKYGVNVYPFGYMIIFLVTFLSVRAIWNYHFIDITPAFAARDIVQAISDALLVLDSEGFICIANRAASDLFGTDTLTGKHVSDVVDDNMFSTGYDSLVKTRRVQFCEILYKGGNDGERVLNVTMSMMADNNNNPLAVICIIQDISGRRRAEKELDRYREDLEFMVKDRTAKLEKEIAQRKEVEASLLKSNQFCSSLMESPTEIIILSVDRDYKYTFFNSAHKKEMQKVWGVDIELGRSLLDYIPSEEERERVGRNFERVLSGERMVKEEAYGEDANRFWYELAYNPIYVNHGEVSGITVFISNITERKTAENILKESEEKFRNLAEESPNMIFINMKGRVVYANHMFEKIMGYKIDEFYSPEFNFSTLVALDSVEKVSDNFQRHIKGEEVEPCECGFVTRGGDRVDVLINSKLIKYERETAILGIVTDITERKKTEQRIECLNRMKEELLRRGSLNDKLLRITRGIVDMFDADFARIWVLKAGDMCESGCVHAEVREGPHQCKDRDRCLHLMSSSGRYTHIDGEIHKRVPLGCYKIGRIASGEINKFLTNDVVHDPQIHEHTWAENLGLVSSAGYRLLSARGASIGVMVLFSTHPISEEEDFLLENIADTAAQVIQTAEAEEEISKSEEKYRLLIQNVDEIIYSVKLNAEEFIHGKLSFISDKIKDILGYMPEDFLDDPRLWIDNIHPDDVRAALQDTEKILKEKKRVTRYYRLRHKHLGEYRYIEDHVVPRVDSEGNVTGLFGVARDITERKQAEEAILNIAKGVSAEVGERFFNSLTEYLTKVLKADYAYVAEVLTDNPDRAKTLSLLADGHVLDNIEVILAGTPCKNVLERNACAYPTGVQRMFPRALTMAELNVDGYIGTVLSGSRGETLGLMSVMYRKPIKNAEMIKSVLQIFASRAAAELQRRQSENKLEKARREIEEWNRELEKRVREKTREIEKSHAQMMMSEKLSSMGQLAAGLAHELNSPLTGLIPLIEKFGDKVEKGTDAYKEIQLMLDASNHMAKIVRDFGAFSRESRGEYDEINLNETIEDTLSFSEGQLRQKQIQVIKEYSDALPVVMGDATELKQVILNMITNARDAMPEGGKLIIKTDSYNNEDKVVMEFIDSGKGIAKHIIDKIFDPFFTTKKHGEGIGLGLTVSYGIVKKYNGSIIVESRPGEGTRFSIILPIGVSKDKRSV